MVKKRYLDEEHPKKRKKKTHKIYTFFVVLLAVLIIFMTIFVLFFVQSIRVSGNNYCSDSMITEAVQNDKYSVNSLYIYGKYKLGYGEIPPCMEKMTVKMTKPWELRVRVEEKPIVGFVFTEQQEYAYFDKEGLIVHIDSEYREGVPQVEGVDVENIRLYSYLKSDNSQIFQKILETSQELKKCDTPADKIECKKERIYVYVGEVCVSLGNQVTFEKVAQIAPIIKELNGTAGTLHLENYSEERNTITFERKEKSEEK